MDSLFLLQFACFMFMLINAIFVALSNFWAFSPYLNHLRNLNFL